jgi:hypothetical protein
MNPSEDRRSRLAWLVAVTASLLLASCAGDLGAVGPAPPDVYENVGAADDFPVGVTRVHDDAWLLKGTDSVQAFVEKPGCPYSLQGTQLVDCRGRETNPRPSGIAPENATPGPPYFDMLARLCTWVYPPAGDVWVYFEPWPGRSPRLDANGNLIDNPNGGSGCPGQGRW